MKRPRKQRITFSKEKRCHGWDPQIVTVKLNGIAVGKIQEHRHNGTFFYYLSAAGRRINTANATPLSLDEAKASAKAWLEAITDPDSELNNPTK